MGGPLLPQLIAGGLSVIILYGIYKILKSIYKIFFFTISLYLLSLLILAKLGFIDIHVDKFQQLVYQVAQWFNSFWYWILDYIMKSHG